MHCTHTKSSWNKQHPPHKKTHIQVPLLRKTQNFTLNQTKQRKPIIELVLKKKKKKKKRTFNLWLTAGWMSIWVSSLLSPTSFSCSLLTCFSWSESATLKSKASFLSANPSPTNACFPRPSSIFKTKYLEESRTVSTEDSRGWPGSTKHAANRSPEPGSSSRISHRALHETTRSRPDQILSDWSHSPHLYPPEVERGGIL